MARGVGQTRRRFGAVACAAVGAIAPSSAAPATSSVVDSSSSGWSSVREIVRMRHQGRLFQRSLEGDCDEYVPFR